MTAIRQQGDLGVDGPDLELFRPEVLGSDQQEEIEQLRSEVARLHTLLVTENVGLSVGILMVHGRCGARAALARLVELALSSGRTMAQEADGLVARYDCGVPGELEVARRHPTG